MRHRRRPAIRTLTRDVTIAGARIGGGGTPEMKPCSPLESRDRGKRPGADRGRPILVAFVSHTADLVGGGEKSLLELIDGLPRDRFSCTVLLPGPGTLEEELKRREISCELVTHRWWTLAPGETRDDAVRSIASFLPGVVHALDRLNPDVIYTNTSVINAGAWAARVLGVPHVWHVREFGEIHDGCDYVLPFAERARYIARRSDLVVFNSPAARDGYALHASPANAQVVYNNVSVQPASAHPERYFIRDTSFKLAVVGSIQPGKGQKEALLAVHELLREGKDVELLLVGRAGDSAYAEDLRSFVEREHLDRDVVFTGLVRNIADVLTQVDLVLVCSRNETFGRVAVEAMLLGKPVIGSRSQGTLQLIREGVNGHLYEPGNIDQLRDLIDSAIADRSVLPAMGAAGRAIMEQSFPAGTCAAQIGAALERLTSARETGGDTGDELERALHATQAAALLDTRALVAHQAALLAGKDVALSEKDAALAERDALIARKDDVLAERDAALAERDAALAERDAAAAALLVEIAEMKSSLRWRIAEPLYVLYARHFRRFVPAAVFRLIDATLKRDRRPPPSPR